MSGSIELGIREQGVGKRLSNLYPWPFVLDGVKCGSIEGFLQSLKFELLDAQEAIAVLTGAQAFKTGQLGNEWKKTQTLWWRGVPIVRQSDEYQALLMRAYDACLEQNVGFVEAILEAGNCVLTHRIGKHDSSATVLTVSEYLHQMYRLRARVRQEIVE